MTALCPECGKPFDLHPCTFQLHDSMERSLYGGTHEERQTVQYLRSRIEELEGEVSKLRGKMEDYNWLNDMAPSFRRFVKGMLAAVDSLEEWSVP